MTGCIQRARLNPPPKALGNPTSTDVPITAAASCTGTWKRARYSVVTATSLNEAGPGSRPARTVIGSCADLASGARTTVSPKGAVGPTPGVPGASVVVVVGSVTVVATVGGPGPPDTGMRSG